MKAASEAATQQLRAIGCTVGLSEPQSLLPYKRRSDSGLTVSFEGVGSQHSHRQWAPAPSEVKTKWARGSSFGQSSPAPASWCLGPPEMFVGEESSGPQLISTPSPNTSHGGTDADWTGGR